MTCPDHQPHAATDPAGIAGARGPVRAFVQAGEYRTWRRTLSTVDRHRGTTGGRKDR